MHFDFFIIGIIRDDIEKVEFKATIHSFIWIWILFSTKYENVNNLYWLLTDHFFENSNASKSNFEISKFLS